MEFFDQIDCDFQRQIVVTLTIPVFEMCRVFWPKNSRSSQLDRSDSVWIVEILYKRIMFRQA